MHLVQYWFVSRVSLSPDLALIGTKVQAGRYAALNRRSSAYRGDALMVDLIIIPATLSKNLMLPVYAAWKLNSQPYRGYDFEPKQK